MKINKTDIDRKINKLIKELMRISDKDDQKMIDDLVQDLICVYTLRHAIKISYRTWVELKKINKKMKEKA